MTPLYIIAAFAVSTAATFFLRSLPFLAFRSRPMPKALDKLGQALPPAIMAVLVVYCLKDVGTDWIGIGLPKLLAVLVVAVVYKWRHNTFWGILAGTAAYMLLIRLM